MAGLHGKNGVFKFNGSALTGVEDISSVGLDVPTVETTAMGDTVDSVVAGIPASAEITVSGQAAAGTTDHDGLATAAAAASSHAFDYQPEGTGTGKGTISGTAYCTGFTISSAFGGKVQWQAKFKPTGTVTFGAQA
jgi:hypothetical protein